MEEKWKIGWKVNLIIGINIEKKRLNLLPYGCHVWTNIEVGHQVNQVRGYKKG